MKTTAEELTALFVRRAHRAERRALRKLERASPEEARVERLRVELLWARAIDGLLLALKG